MSESTKKKTMKASAILGPVIVLIIGILLCIGVSGSDVLTKIIGVIALLAGVGLLVEGYITTHSLVFGSGMPAAFFISIGITCFITTLPFDIMIPMLLIVFGTLLLAEGIIVLAVRKNKMVGIIEISLGAIALTLGFLLYFIADFKKYASLVLGIYFIVSGILGLIKILVTKNTKAA